MVLFERGCACLVRTTSVPRALKLPTGLAVSSLMLTAHPRTGSSASQRYSGVPRKTGSITRRAARILAVSRRVFCTAQQRSAVGAAPCAGKPGRARVVFAVVPVYLEVLVAGSARSVAASGWSYAGTVRYARRP